MNKYDEAFKGGCGLTASTIEYLEGVKAAPTIYSQKDKNGRERVYVAHTGAAYGAGGRVYSRRFVRCIGFASAERSAFSIQLEAIYVMGVGGLNRHAIKWLKEYLSKKAS